MRNLIPPHAITTGNRSLRLLRYCFPVAGKSWKCLRLAAAPASTPYILRRNCRTLIWHSSDLQENHAGIKLWLDEAKLANTPPPLLLDVNQAHWPELDVDAIFCANTIHIIDWDSVKTMIAGAGRLLPDKGILALYGPFNYDNAYTSESNARFDIWLRQRDPDSGIRNFEDVDKLANSANLYLQQDYAMPANNRLICWRKQRRGT